MGQIIRSELARRDVARIWHYIALDNPRAADRLLDQIEHAIQLPSDNPGMGARRMTLSQGYECIPCEVFSFCIVPRRAESILLASFTVRVTCEHSLKNSPR